MSAWFWRKGVRLGTHNARLGRPPLPETVRPWLLEYSVFMRTSKWRRCLSSLRSWRRSVVEGDFQHNQLYHNHEEGLDQQGNVESCARVVEYPARKAYVSDESKKRDCLRGLAVLTLAWMPSA